MTCHASLRSRAVTAAGASWHGALGACLGQLEPLPPGVNLGIVYFGDPLAPMADDIVRALRERTGIRHWLGACGAGVLGGPPGAGSDSGLAVLVLELPEDGFRLLPSAAAPPPGRCGLLLAHAELEPADPAAQLAELEAHGATTLVGGLAAAGRSPVQIAGTVMGGAVACVGFDERLPVAGGIATAGAPLGPSHRVTSAVGGDILALDGRPAFQVMSDELGDLFRHAGDRFAPSLWLAERSAASGGAEALRMRRITATDRACGALRLEGARPGAEVRLMRLDPAGSLARLDGLAGATLARLHGRPAIAGIYLASRHRGRGLFGTAVDEIAVLRRELGQLPLIGLVTDAEIFDGAIHEGAGVLVLIG
jgi:small ligand-binding sensory domain FIST